MGAALGGPATSGGAANAATYQGLKNQLINENLSSIAAQDVRLAAAAKGSVWVGKLWKERSAYLSSQPNTKVTYEY